MQYNTSLPRLIIPEYGRNIHRMIAHAITLQDRDERNKISKAIIDVMGQLNPHLRDVSDFKHKLWDHLFIISEFKLDVDSPYPKPLPESFTTKPERISYPSNNIKFKHYGKTIEMLIQKAISMEEGEMKNAFVEVIANLMKRSYINWNRDTVSDEVILEHLASLSKNQLKLKENVRLAFSEYNNYRHSQNNNKKKKKQTNKKKF